MMKRAGTSVAMVAVVLTLVSGVQAASTRVGYVDVQRIIVRSVAGVAAREQLEKEKTAMQKDVDTRRNEVEKLREELEKKGLVLSADAKREKEESLQRRVRDLRRLVDDFQKELERKEQGLTQKMLLDLNVLIERVGKDRGYLMILEKRGASVIYADPEADLTDEIIKVYDQDKGKEKK